MNFGAIMRSSSSEGGARTDSDIDLMVVAESLDCLDLHEALQTSEQTLDRSVNPNRISPSR